MEKSPIDELFFSLYQFYPAKKGKAFELLVAAAIKIVTGQKVNLDHHVKGIFSQTDYQIDKILQDDSGEIMIEAKDYSSREAKVGRDDLQTMQGALTELDFVKGVFASATDFTQPAKKYAAATCKNPMQKLIDLYHIRPSTEDDEKGRIRKFEVKLCFSFLNFDEAQFQVAWTADAVEKFRTKGLINKPIKVRLDSFFNSDGTLFQTLEEFTNENPPIWNPSDKKESYGCWVLMGKVIKYLDEVYPIKGIVYRIPYTDSRTTLTIMSEGQPKVLIRSDDGRINKLLTDEQLRQVTFGD